MLKNLWYKLTCRYWFRYNTVVCKAIPPTWIDRDLLLLYAAFQILEDFVEKERGHFYEDVYTLYVEQCGVEDARRRAETWEIVRELYNWWQKRKQHFDDYEEDTAMLHKLIDVRGVLWT
jgi:hypothetical protein